MRWKDGDLVAVPDGEVDITTKDVQFPIADLPIIFWALNAAAEAERGSEDDCHHCPSWWSRRRRPCPAHIWGTVYRDLADRLQKEFDSIADRSHHQGRWVTVDGHSEWVTPHRNWHTFSELNRVIDEMFANREQFGIDYQPDTKV